MLTDSAAELATIRLAQARVTVEVGGTAEVSVVVGGRSDGSTAGDAVWTPIGSQIVIAAEVGNLSSGVLEVAVVVQGVDPAWCTVIPTSLSLVPGDNGLIELRICPPEGAEFGSYPFEVRIWGAANGREGEFIPARRGGRRGDASTGTLVIGEGGFRVAFSPGDLTIEGEGRRGRAKVWMPSAPSPDLALDLTVEGLERSWAELSPSSLVLRSGEEAKALLVFHPPRHCPGSRLGQQNFVVTARERDGHWVSRVAGVLRVVPFGGQTMQSSYLQYLPSIYSSDPMVGRLLLIFESILKPLEGVIDQMALYFDPELAPEEFVPWLAWWVGLSLDEKLPLQRRRQMVKRAMELYRWRGTRRGLKQSIELATGVTALIVENFDGLRLDREARLGLNAHLGHRQDHTFVVTLVVPPDVDADAALDVARTIIEEDKPAHLTYLLRAAPQPSSGAPPGGA
ncbi:MAG: phage tail protein [Chloroflexota bacterium]